MALATTVLIHYTSQIWATLSVPMFTLNKVSCLLSWEEILSLLACTRKTSFYCPATLCLSFMGMRKILVSHNFFFLVRITMFSYQFKGPAPSALYQQILVAVFFWTHLDIKVAGCPVTSALWSVEEQFLSFCLSSFSFGRRKCWRPSSLHVVVGAIRQPRLFEGQESCTWD